jgi:hypothetical protein
MGKPIMVIVSVLVLVVAVIFFLPLWTQKGRTLAPDAAKTIHGDVARDQSRANPSASNEGGSGAPETGTSTDPALAMQRSAKARAKIKLSAQTSLEDIASLKRILAEAQPGARNMFENGMALMKSGHFPEARSVFQSFILNYPGSALEPPAYFGIGVASYLGGDSDKAADQFNDFMMSFSKDTGLEDFFQAAQIDLAVAEIQLMRSASNEEDRRAAAGTASFALTNFLLKRPNSPQAPAARVALNEVLTLLTRPR